MLQKKSPPSIDFKAEHMFYSEDAGAQVKTILEGWKATLRWEPDGSVDVCCPGPDLLVPVVAQGRAEGKCSAGCLGNTTVTGKFAVRSLFQSTLFFFQT